MTTRPAKGTVGDSYDNAMAESVNGAYKTELVWRSKPFRTLGELELATFHGSRGGTRSDCTLP